MTLNVGTVLDLERKRIAAMLAGDIEALDGLLSPDVVWVHASSHEDSKASFLDGFRQGRLIAHSLAPSDQTVHIYGDAGLCHGTITIDATMAGKRATATHRYSTLWVGQDESARLVIYQATPTTL